MKKLKKSLSVAEESSVWCFGDSDALGGQERKQIKVFIEDWRIYLFFEDPKGTLVETEQNDKSVNYNQSLHKALTEMRTLHN